MKLKFIIILSLTLLSVSVSASLRSTSVSKTRARVTKSIVTKTRVTKSKISKFDDIGRIPTLIPIKKTTSVVTPKNHHFKCQSYSQCSFKVKQYYQSGVEIYSHMLGNKNTCAPTASAILLSGIMAEKRSSTKPLGDMKKFSEEKRPGAQVAILGKGMGTLNKSGGGTMPFALPFIGDMKTFFKKQFKFSGTKEVEQKSYGSLFTYPKRSQAQFTNEIRKKKPGYLITVTSHKKKNKRWVREGDTIFRLGGHVMAITGYYGSNIQIDDPWKRKYYVKMKQEKIKTCRFCFKANKTVLTPTSKYSNGYIGKVSREGKKLILRQYIKLKAY